MRTVALIGPDGAGKSTIARAVVRALPVPARHLYMGVNLESSGRMLPTTRLVLRLKRARHGRTPSQAALAKAVDAELKTAGARNLTTQAYSAVRLLAWLAEEWYRAVVALQYSRRGYIVVFDRHFLYDYYASHVVRRSGRTFAARAHGRLLRRWYPRPDLVICLDAPAALLFARKGEHDVAALEQRRKEYLALAQLVPDFAVVDASQPLADVVAEITRMIEERTSEASAAAGKRPPAER